MVFAGEAQKSSYFDQKPKYLIKFTPGIPRNFYLLLGMFGVILIKYLSFWSK